MKLAAAVSLLALVKGERVSIYLYRLVRLPLFQASLGDSPYKLAVVPDSRDAGS